MDWKGIKRKGKCMFIVHGVERNKWPELWIAPSLVYDSPAPAALPPFLLHKSILKCVCVCREVSSRFISSLVTLDGYPLSHICACQIQSTASFEFWSLRLFTPLEPSWPHWSAPSSLFLTPKLWFKNVRCENWVRWVDMLVYNYQLRNTVEKYSWKMQLRNTVENIRVWLGGVE